MRTARRDAEFSEWAHGAQQSLFRKACLLTGDPEAARDLVQQVLLSTYLAWSRVDHPTAYARTSLVRAYLRTTKDRGREVELTDAMPVAAPTRDADSALALIEAMADLPPRMRATVVLRFWEDLSVRETALLLGCSDGTVKSTASKALAHLRRRLGDDFDVDPTSASLSGDRP